MIKQTNPDSLQSLPGVGPRIAQVLQDLGYRHASDLVSEDPERMFQDLCTLHNEKIDRCVLYTFRCAVHVAGSEEHDTEHDPELRKWWNWKDREL